MKPSNTSLRFAIIGAENGIRNLMNTKQGSNHSDEMFRQLLSKAISPPIKPLLIEPLGVTLITLHFVHTVH